MRIRRDKGLLTLLARYSLPLLCLTICVFQFSTQDKKTSFRKFPPSLDLIIECSRQDMASKSHFSTLVVDGDDCLLIFCVFACMVSLCPFIYQGCFFSIRQL